MATSTAPITVRYLGGDRLRIQTRGHEVTSDQPVDDGGEDTAPTPTELFLGGLAGCIGFYAQRFLRRHGLPADGLAVTCTYRWAENPHRVGAIELTIDAPGLTADRREAFSRVIEHCTVHNTLRQPPDVQIRVTTTSSPLPVLRGG